MFVTQAVKTRVEKKVAECIAKADKYFNKKHQIPRIEYTVRGQKGGYAQGTGLVNFNPILLMENIEDYMTDTIPHEVAHCIDAANGRDDNFIQGWAAFALRGRRAKRVVHGESWKQIMRMLGSDPERCHNYDVKNAQVKVKAKYDYRCGGCNQSFLVSSVLHNKMQRGQKRWCRKCGRDRGQLVYAQALGKVTYGEAKEIRDERTQKIEDTKARLREKLLFVPPTLIPQPVLSQETQVTITDRARKIYGMYNHLGRGVTIKKMVEIGVKETTASTYYQNFKVGK